MADARSPRSTKANFRKKSVMQQVQQASTLTSLLAAAREEERMVKMYDFSVGRKRQDQAYFDEIADHTLVLKAVLDKLEVDDGSIKWGYETHPGYFAQDHHEVLHNPKATLKSWLWDHSPGQSVGFVHGKLAEVLFDQDDIEKKIENLSGGEGARLVFATLGVKKPNVLVLDEPTNHLDLEGIASLAKGLKAFEGTILFVSHDRWFVDKLATRVIDLREDGITDFRGTWAEYLAAQEADRLSREAALEAERQKKRDARAKKAAPPSPAQGEAGAKRSKKKKQKASAENERSAAPAADRSGGRKGRNGKRKGRGRR